MKKNVWKILAAIISLTVMLSFSLVTVMADETTAEDTTEATTEADTEATTDAGTEASTGADTSASTGAGTASGTTTTEKTNKTHFGLVTIIIVVVILIGFAIWALRDREKSAKTLRSFKSEFKKIVWADPHDTLKNTILVVVAIVVFAAVLGLIDYLLSLLIVTIGSAI